VYKQEIKEKAIKLRKQGYSIKEIAKIINIAQGTSSSWVSSIELDLRAQERLKKRKILGQYKSINIAKKKKLRTQEQNNIKALSLLNNISKNKELYKLICSILFWTEGGKSTDSYVYFTNSDPTMVVLFVTLIRKSFPVQEGKFRALIHVHEYHNEREIKNFWSKITKIPISQFSKTYLKPHTQKRIRKGYKGSIRIRYYDHKIALELRSIYNMFAKNLGS